MNCCRPIEKGVPGLLEASNPDANQKNFPSAAQNRFAGKSRAETKT